jgi:type II secretory pathway pseudopilin PulG
MKIIILLTVLVIAAGIFFYIRRRNNKKKEEAAAAVAAEAAAAAAAEAAAAAAAAATQIKQMKKKKLPKGTSSDKKKKIATKVKSKAPPPPPTYRYVRIIRDKDGNNHWMNLAEVEVFSRGTNVASGKTVRASSLLSDRYPHTNLVDGNKKNFAHTNNEAVEWFLIDLGQAYEIEKVVIHNRLDCCQGRLRNTKIQLSKSANMSSPKQSRPITTQEAPNAVITWNVKTDKIIPGGYEWGLMDPNIEHTGWSNDIKSYEECAKLAKDRGHLAWGIQTGYHPSIVKAGKSIGGCWTRPNLTKFTRLVPGDINHVSGCADPTKLVSSKCV